MHSCPNHRHRQPWLPVAAPRRRRHPPYPSGSPPCRRTPRPRHRQRASSEVSLSPLAHLIRMLKKRRRPSRSDGAAAKRARRLQERRWLSRESIVRWRQWSLLELPRAMPAGSALRHLVIRWHLEKRRIRLRPLNIRQRVGAIAKTRIAPLAHHHHLQIIGIPMLGHDGNRFFISDLSRGDGVSNSRSLRAHASNRLRSQLFFFQVTAGNRLLLPVLHLAPAHTPHLTVRRAFHRSKVLRHLLGRLCVGVQDEIRIRHRIVDHDKRLRLPRCSQRPNRRERHFLAEAALAVAKKIRLGFARDAVSIPKGLRCFGNGDRAERRARHHFSAVHSFEAQQLDALTDWPSQHPFARPAGNSCFRRRCFLCPQRSCGSCQHSSEEQVPTYSAIHYFVSSSL